jgi:SHS2 domain-containing protein
MSRKASEPAWKILDHTADIRLEVRGATLKELFRNAWLGLRSVLTSDVQVVPERELSLHLDAAGTEDLLVDWLREILFHNQTRGFVPVEIEIDALSGTHLDARLKGGTPTSGRASELEIKGVTYHGLIVEKTHEGYVARIVFDI